MFEEHDDGGLDVDTQVTQAALSAQACSCAQHLESEHPPHVASLRSKPHWGSTHIGSLAHDGWHSSHIQSRIAMYWSAPVGLLWAHWFWQAVVVQALMQVMKLLQLVLE